MAVNTNSRLWRDVNLDQIKNRRVVHMVAPSFLLTNMSRADALEGDMIVGKGVEVVDSGLNRAANNTGSVVNEIDVVSATQEKIGSTREPIKLQLGNKKDDFQSHKRPKNTYNQDNGSIARNILV